MITFGFKLGASRENEDDRGAGAEIGPGQSFSVGFALTFVGLPGALPYFAAIDQILRADLGAGATYLGLLYYNFVCSMPLIGIVVTRVILGQRSEPIFHRLAEFLSHWSHRLIVIALMLLGILLTIDGAFVASGHPLITYERPESGG
jgi:cytochrome c biogenesis protein CcdA